MEMAHTLEAAEDFKRTLEEVDILLGDADAAGEDECKLGVMNKSAVLLLMGKFEAFLESAIEEYLFAISSLGARASHIPERLLLQHSVESVREIEIVLNKNDLAKVKRVFTDLGRLWAEAAPCDSLKVTSAFDYGSHGENEVCKLFKRVGFDKVFTLVEVSDESEDLAEGEHQAIVDVAGIINSLTCMRNNILHENASPSLTTNWIRQQRNILSRFADGLVALFEKSVDETKARIQTGANTDGS
jgi:hypothetical protein